MYCLRASLDISTFSTGTPAAAAYPDFVEICSVAVSSLSREILLTTLGATAFSAALRIATGAGVAVAGFVGDEEGEGGEEGGEAGGEEGDEEGEEGEVVGEEEGVDAAVTVYSQSGDTLTGP